MERVYDDKSILYFSAIKQIGYPILIALRIKQNS